MIRFAAAAGKRLANNSKESWIRKKTSVFSVFEIMKRRGYDFRKGGPIPELEVQYLKGAVRLTKHLRAIESRGRWNKYYSFSCNIVHFWSCFLDLFYHSVQMIKKTVPFTNISWRLFKSCSWWKHTGCWFEFYSLLSLSIFLLFSFSKFLVNVSLTSECSYLFLFTSVLSLGPNTYIHTLEKTTKIYILLYFDLLLIL